MAFQAHEQIADTLTDAIALALRELDKMPRWTQAKHALFDRIAAMAKEAGYLQFQGHSRAYLLTRKGSACLYDVPLQQLGALRPWRGQRVRLICAGALNGYSDRIYLAHPVPSLP